MRLIDADAILAKYNGNILTAQIDYAEGARDVIKDIKDAPTIDAVSVVHGEWIPHPTEEEWDVCTACGTGCKRREIGYDTYFERPYVTEYGYPFCPNCGAKMKGADDE